MTQRELQAIPVDTAPATGWYLTASHDPVTGQWEALRVGLFAGDKARIIHVLHLGPI